MQRCLATMVSRHHAPCTLLRSISHPPPPRWPSSFVSIPSQLPARRRSNATTTGNNGEDDEEENKAEKERKQREEKQMMDALMSEKKQSRDAAVAILFALRPSVASFTEDEKMKLIHALPGDALASLEASGRKDMMEVKDAEVRVVVPKERTEFVIAGSDGETLRDLVRRGTKLNQFLECACGGNMACSTCHVYIRNPPTEKALDGSPLVEPASEEEKDMLDLAYEPKEGVSRLGCQVKLKRGKRLEVELPDEWYNNFN